MSVAFDFNASLNDVAPLSPILLAVIFMRMEKSCLLIDAICVLLSFAFTLFNLSSMSVVFDFNASLSDVAPPSLIQFPVDLMRMEMS